MNRCEIVLALPRFHALHQEDNSVIEALISVFQHAFLHDPQLFGWSIQANQTETENLVDGLTYAWDFAHEHQQDEHAFVVITTPEMDMREVRHAIMRCPHNARVAIVVVAEPGIDTLDAWFITAAALARESRVMAVSGQDVLEGIMPTGLILGHLAGAQG